MNENHRGGGPAPRRIPADIDQPDRVLAGLTARQLAILAGSAGLLLAGWHLCQSWLPAPAFLAIAGLVAVTAVIVALGRHRDGTSLDAHLLAAARYLLLRVRHQLAPRPAPPPYDSPWQDTDPEPDPEIHDPGSGLDAPADVGVPDWLAHRATGLTTPEAVGEHTGRTAAYAASAPAEHPGQTGSPATTNASAVGLPVRGVLPAASEVGVLDLSRHGLAVLAIVTPVPFAWASGTQQQIVLDSFTRLLCAIDLPMQILIRALPINLQPALDELAHHTRAHPALAAAAADHHDYLADLHHRQDVLTRQVLLVLRDPTPTPHPTRAAHGLTGATTRLLRSLDDAHTALAPAGITVTALSASHTRTVLATATHPHLPDPSGPSPHSGSPTYDAIHHSPSDPGEDRLDSALDDARHHSAARYRHGDDLHV